MPKQVIAIVIIQKGRGQLLARRRHSKSVDGLPLSGQQRSLSEPRSPAVVVLSERASDASGRTRRSEDKDKFAGQPATGSIRVNCRSPADSGRTLTNRPPTTTTIADRREQSSRILPSIGQAPLIDSNARRRGSSARGRSAAAGCRQSPGVEGILLVSAHTVAAPTGNDRAPKRRPTEAALLPSSAE